MPTPSPTFTPITAYGRTFSEEEFKKMPPEAQALILSLAMESALKETKTPQPSFSKTPSPTKTPTPSKAGKAIRHGQWVMDPESNKKIYKGDPRYDQIMGLGAGVEAITGVD
jgi:hypothetical protein